MGDHSNSWCVCIETHTNIQTYWYCDYRHASKEASLLTESFCVCGLSWIYLRSILETFENIKELQTSEDYSKVDLHLLQSWSTSFADLLHNAIANGFTSMGPLMFKMGWPLQKKIYIYIYLYIFINI